MAAKRKNLSNTIRFEVFKRDSFTCQYCGRMAPDVVLEVDHIHPVSKGGDNDILNLITSCMECNRGKGARKLTDKDEIKKQQQQLKELNEKRIQLEMLVEWKAELLNFDVEQYEKIKALIEDIVGWKVKVSEDSKNHIIKQINKYGFETIYEATKIAFTNYYDESKNNLVEAFRYISRIAWNIDRDKKDPMNFKRNYLKKTIKKRFSYFNQERLSFVLNKLVTDEYEYERVYSIACNSKSWTNFYENIEYEYDL